tara:strand:- start:48 stop:542 length:495 start_codon:yes stop_codon:yes gene_type:complete
MNYLKISLAVLFCLSVSRFIPHPPNFTSLLALSFYIPVAFGYRFIPVVILSLIFTDIVIGMHSTILYTWGSVLIIGLVSKYFNKSLISRLFGSFSGAVLFYIFTNFGVWLSGGYGYNLNGFAECYILALPFFGYSAISTVIFSVIFESFYKFYLIFQKNYLSYK